MRCILPAKVQVTKILNFENIAPNSLITNGAQFDDFTITLDDQYLKFKLFDSEGYLSSKAIGDYSDSFIGGATKWTFKKVSSAPNFNLKHIYEKQEYPFISNDSTIKGFKES